MLAFERMSDEVKLSITAENHMIKNRKFQETPYEKDNTFLGVFSLLLDLHWVGCREL